MAKPILLSVDDDADVLRAIERDLRSKYGGDYRVLGSGSPESALDLLKQLKLRSDSVALLLADQRMPRIDGVHFLQEAMRIFPDAKRALLTAYADTNAAIGAINQASIHYFFMKPWDPPTEHLYPQLDDLLEDWQAYYHPSFSGIRVLGTRWSPRSYEMRDFLARNHVPYQWIDAEISASDPETKVLLETLGKDAASLPVVLFPDGTKFLESTPAQVAQKVGLRTRAQTSFYDLAIIGGGPAGLAAAVYGASEGLHTVMVEKEAPGGQAGMSSRIENYLGFPAGLSGGDLARRAVVQATRFGVEILAAEAAEVRIEGPYRILKLADGSEFSCHALMIATGVQWRRLDAPGIGRAAGSGRVLRRRSHGSFGLRGRNGLCNRRGKLGGAGGNELCQTRRKSDHSGARKFAVEHHVPIPDRSDQGDAEHSGMAARQRCGSARGYPPGGNFRSVHGHRKDRARSGDQHVHFYRRIAAHRMAGGDGRARRSRLFADRAGFDRQRRASQGLDAGPRSVPAGNECARNFCRGRCAPRFSQARRIRRGRRVGGRAIHPSILEQSPMNAAAELLKVPVFADLPEDQIEWFLNHADSLSFKAGDVLMTPGAPADSFIVILEGEIQARGEFAGETMFISVGAGQVTGRLPFSRMKTFTFGARAMTDGRLLRFPEPKYQELVQKMPELTQRLVGMMTDRVRETTRREQQRDRLAALGKLSAGLAHELNNPASAAKRASSQLRDHPDENSRRLRTNSGGAN